MQKPDALSCAMMALVGAMWGLHGPAIKLAFAAGFTFPQLVLGEYLVGATVFCAAVAWRRLPVPRGRRFWTILLAASVVACGVPLFLFWAYRLGPVSIGATLLFLYVPFTQLLNFFVTRRRPPGVELASAGLVITGAVIAADFVGTANADNLRGAPLAVLAALCFAAFFVLTARIGREGTAELRSGVCCVVSCGMMLVIAGAAGWSLLPAVPSGVALAWLLTLGVLGQVIPVFLLVHFGPRTGSALGSILTSTELPVAVIASAILLGDKVGPAQIAGVALVLFGIALPHLRRFAPAVAAPDGM
ncbi:MAG: DMT family transporter [Burkholderiales bacterium]|nr:DMT family transporter [Opitutaceae bacterium]